MSNPCRFEKCGHPEFRMHIGCEKCPEIKTIVVNLKYKPYTKYIGRSPCYTNKFANEYRIGPDGTREDVIAKHKKDFYNNPELQEAVWNELRGEVLGCFCKPLTCHGDTYVEYIENRERIEDETGQNSV